MPTAEQIADAIDQRLADAGRELASLQAARAVLVQESLTTSGSRAAESRRNRARRSATRSSSKAGRRPRHARRGQTAPSANAAASLGRARTKQLPTKALPLLRPLRRRGPRQPARGGARLAGMSNHTRADRPAPERGLGHNAVAAARPRPQLDRRAGVRVSWSPR